jgi:3-dehydroquinate dehydratase-1
VGRRQLGLIQTPRKCLPHKILVDQTAGNQWNTVVIRAQTRFGNFVLGDKPRIVGCVSQPATLAKFPSNECDIVELRLDLLGDIPLPAISQPVIATLRLANEGGKWTRPDQERLPAFEAALRQYTAVDVEWRSPILPEVSALAVKHQKALIVSYHDFEKTPSAVELRQVMDRAANYGTVVKIATFTRTEDDLQTLRELFRYNCSAALCVLGMGPLAATSRHELPKLGSCLVYGYLDAPIAPGQPAARDLTIPR